MSVEAVYSAAMSFTEKNLQVRPVTVVGGRHVKWYEVVTPGLVVTDDLREAAARFLPKLFPDFDDSTPPATFAVLHLSSAGAYLNAYNWAWDNVIHCRTAASGDQPFLGSHHKDITHFTELDKPFIGCVWELPPLEHERSAWVRHMFDTETPDLDAYLADVFLNVSVGR